MIGCSVVLVSSRRNENHSRTGGYSPLCRSYRLANSRLKTLPINVRGKSSMKMTKRGTRWDGHEPDESRSRRAACKLSRLKARPTMVIAWKNLRSEVREADDEQRVSAGTSNTAADLGKLHSKLFTQSPEWTIGCEKRGDKKGEYPGLSRCLPPFAHTAPHYLDAQIAKLGLECALAKTAYFRLSS